MKYKYGPLFLTAAAGGVYLSLMYINPYNGVITLSETILQLSGSRGRLHWGFLILNLLLLPCACFLSL